MWMVRGRVGLILRSRWRWWRTSGSRWSTWTASIHRRKVNGRPHARRNRTIKMNGRSWSFTRTRRRTGTVRHIRRMRSGGRLGRHLRWIRSISTRVAGLRCTWLVARSRRMVRHTTSTAGLHRGSRSHSHGLLRVVRCVVRSVRRRGRRIPCILGGRLGCIHLRIVGHGRRLLLRTTAV